ncbi:MAG: ABC transporter substrate-binding protein [Candidatus Binatia bacterium]
MPTQLDPRYATDAHSSRIGSLVFASLTRSNASGSVQPYLAESWSREGPRLYRFRIRRDFRFHDGTPVAAEDVVATYHSLMDRSMASPRRATLSSVESVSVGQGEAEVVFRLKTSDASFLDATSAGVLPRRFAGERDLAPDELVGSGPYSIERVADDELISLVAFGDFADGRPAIPRIEFRVIPDGTMRALELQHGSIDMVQNALDPDTVDWLRQDSTVLSVLRSASNSFQYIGMNLEHPALSDVRVRRALAVAVDREAIVEHLLNGKARVASGVLPPHHWAFEGNVRRYHYNPARARSLLERAGLQDPDGPDGPLPRLRLSYKTTTDELRRRIAEAISNQLAGVGIELQILSYEWGTFYADVKRGSFHLYSLAWVGITDPDIFRTVFHSDMAPPDGANRGRFSDPIIDRLVDRARTVCGQRTRARIYARVQKRAARLLPYIPLWWPDNVVVANTRLENFSPHPSGDLFLLWKARLEDPEDLRIQVRRP